MENSNDEPRWKPYVGREVQFVLNTETLFGVLNEPNLKKGYADFLPYWSTEADGERIRIEKEVPLRVSLSILEKAEAIIRPFISGSMEARSSAINDSIEKKKNTKLGFSSENN
jgi:hypothetical protein